MRVPYAIGIAVTAALLTQTATAVDAQTPAPAVKRAAPARGLAELGFVQSAKLDQKTNSIITVFQVKNMAQGSIVGLTITEFWYDKASNPVQGTGDRQRLRAPLQPGEVATITLTSPKVVGMATPQYKFEHSNGTIKPTKLKAIK